MKHSIVFIAIYFCTGEAQIRILGRNKLLNETRRILRGEEVDDTRPYMVYLRPAGTVAKQLINSNWLCGGVIISAQYVLTSAACIEDVQHFYVISGTHRWIPLDMSNDCIKYGAKKAVWKCVPKDYVFDGKEFENIRWMVNDIAVVKVEEDFNFNRRIRGCDFIPKLIAFNNQSEELEAAGTVASIAGWGSVERFGDNFGRSTMNSPELLETDVVLISKQKCKAGWPERYHYIIDGNMVCAKDGVDSDAMNTMCKEQEINCKELVYSKESDTDARRYVLKPENLRVHSAKHMETRRSQIISGGFCENDHGGPLVVGHGKGSVVIGVISACMSANITQKCYGPFLYTSVWKNRHVISCAIDKDQGHNDEDDRFNNICLKNGAKKAIWKCIPRNYVFDGHENDNIRWMNNDIAIVKVEDEFDFNRRVRGCDFVPRPICYNNQTSRYEEPGNVASIAGWGSTDKYNDWVNKGGSSTTQDLLEADVVIITKNNCKRQWGPRYHSIIDNYMICSRDTIPELSEVCNEKYVECTDIMYSMEESRRVDPSELRLHSAFHNESGRRQEAASGGFCENDHGGPLVYGQGSSAIVIGIISACLVKERTNKCYGPYLYTSVYKNRMLINCAIYKDIAGDCTKLFRASDTHVEEHISWADHPDGPAKNEISKMRRTEEEKIKNNTLKSNRTEHNTPLDKVIKHGGVVLRAFEESEEFDKRLENTNTTRR
ncbi:unnamed protein product [Danaus chrysippus]|uniref:(African queen) hypothetical protein n=1 Tax=Danaus chrysippus TaxID=151541 RepID=A0A8J2QRF4_9NEOP|nr:unnamed protein product [Danaus chrysippus]